MPIRSSNRLIQRKLWRVVGFMSSVIGLICYALSSSFKHLFGEWNFLKVIIYSVVSFSISSMMLFLKKWRLSRNFLLKAHVGVLVLMVTYLYSFFYDKAVHGNPDLLSLISCAAFALMSLSLSRHIELGLEADLLNFFLGCFTVQLMKINLMLAIIAAVVCYSLMVLRSYMDSQSQIGTPRMEDQVTLEIDAANGADRGAEEHSSDFRSDYSNRHQQMQSLRRRVDDGYNWRKYEEKQVKGSGNERSYYKCTYPNCPARMKVESSLDGKIIDVLHNYKGLHIHHKPVLTMKRNSSSESFDALLPSESDRPETPDQLFASHGSEQLDCAAAPESSSISI